MMNKAKLVINSDITKFIKNNYPVAKKRTALWFFSNELRNNLNPPHDQDRVEQGSSGHAKSAKHTNSTNPKTKISSIKIFNMWRKMDPESKRKYFNMAEFDDLRYREQKSQWISEVCGLVLRHGASLDELNESAPTHQDLQESFLASLHKLHKSYEQMIQFESTKEIYKDAIKKADRHECRLSQVEILSALPKSQRSVLARPRRPPAAFVLYVQDNVKRLTEALRSSSKYKTVMQVGASEWSNLDASIKAKYDEKYEQLKSDYDKAMEEFRIANLEADDNYLEQATKEKKAFKRSLRKRLRDSSVLPLSIRNPFNFFLMDNKDVPLTDLTEIWRTLPMDKKLKYMKLNETDVIRYQNEREIYNEITKSLNDIINKKKSDQSKEADDDKLGSEDKTFG